MTTPSATKLRPAQVTSRRRRAPLGRTCWVRRKIPVLETLVDTARVAWSSSPRFQKRTSSWRGQRRLRRRSITEAEYRGSRGAWSPPRWCVDSGSGDRDATGPADLALVDRHHERAVTQGRVDRVGLDRHRQEEGTDETAPLPFVVVPAVRLDGEQIVRHAHPHVVGLRTGEGDADGELAVAL